MKQRRALAVTAFLLPLLSGCSTVTSTLFPDRPDAPQASSLPPTIVAAPQSGTSQFNAVAVSPGSATGTSAGVSIAAVRTKLVTNQGRLSARNVTLSSIRQDWTSDVAAYRVQKNQVLRPPPQSNTKTALAQGEAALRRLAQHTGRLSAEMEGFAQGNADTNILMSQLDALPTSDEQDSRQLNQLRGEIVQTSSALDSLVNALSAEVAQNNAFIAKERASIVALAQGHAPQTSARQPTQPGANPATVPAGPAPQAPVNAQTAMQRSAFVTIKFDRPNVAYREALATALTQALKRRPEASFDIVGVSATATADAEELVRARAEDVSRTMMELGVPAAKLAIDATSLKTLIADEVRIFVH